MTRPWEDFAVCRESYFVAEGLIDEFAPQAIPAEAVTSAFVRLCHRAPRDDELMDIWDQLRNYGIQILP